ncbi:hypothetical protein P280DRAFT_407289 [Massarina eburnea CBS 473.64]|uniref:Zn(2)-C6 fungal-type domain-containing protein n=1 Tax=Massarina eburnea CBS 473.64 TaxID=1395130 RepID=A0A6A6RR90_9PLEO|nr:hypothetical protein P280DRAFT_407289 [Massarina eburnea CBS 473.64]
MELSTGTEPSTVSGAQQHAAARRVRVALACQRCKGRKQRCDGGNPSCKSCLKVGIDCVYEPTLRPRYPGGKMLYAEIRIAFLEAQLPEHGRDHFGHIDTEKGMASIHKRQNSISNPGQPDQELNEEDSTLVDGVAYLSLCASGTTDSAPEPFYMGSSSGATIARLVQSSIFHNKKDSDSSAPFHTLSTGSMSSDSAVLTPSVAINLTEYPPPAQAQRLFSVFFNRLHTRWPILDRKLYEQIYNHQYDQDTLPVIERSSLHLIYAISARFLQLTKQAIDVNPEVHFTAALRSMDLIMEQHSSSTVQFLTLLAIYGQRSPYGAGVWSQVRYAITLCVELGMHRRPTAHSPWRNLRELEIRRRVFWSCYCLDRMTSMLLGRTFAISDRDINVELPSDCPTLWDLTSTTPPLGDGKGWSSIMPFIHVINLRQIQSRIQRTVFRVDIDPAAPSVGYQARIDSKAARIRRDLDAWVTSIPEQPPDVEGGPRWMYQPEKSQASATYQDSSDFFTLQYHKSILSLYTTILPSLNTNDQRFVSCAQSAARICTTYKRLNQQKILSFTIIGLHSCFVAGLTLIYCLWRDRASFNFDILEATRACSQCLTIFGEKWPGAVKYGDIFEALSSSVLRAIMEPTHVGTPNLHINLDILKEPNLVSGTSTKTQKATDPLVGAVRDVFMEADEDAPGGWQGWRVFNEMVQTDIQEPGLFMDSVAEAESSAREVFPKFAWGDSGGAFTDPNLDMTDAHMTHQGTWNHGFFPGYE